MAELATIARPYADALYEVARKGDLKQSAAELDAVAAVAGNAQLRQFASSPDADATQILDLMASVAQIPLSYATRNLLEAIIDNGRLAALPEVAVQFHERVNADSGASDAMIYSAFEINAEQLESVGATLEKRFGRKLLISVKVTPELIGGIRVVVGDEVLDTSVKARLEQMKMALTA